jgi:hypothetical protein
MSLPKSRFLENMNQWPSAGVTCWQLLEYAVHVGDRTVRLGQFVQPGTRLFTVVPT